MHSHTGFKTVIKLLIEKGSNVNALDQHNMSPLCRIARTDFGHWTDDYRLGE